jgi:hypothetical protein
MLVRPDVGLDAPPLAQGIGPSREGRHAALLALAARLPAPILAERIGIHQARAAQWVGLAGSIYADYVATRHAG